MEEYNEMTNDELPTRVYIDDLIIIGYSIFVNHLSNLDTVMNILKNISLNLILKKSFWCQESVKYLGFTLKRKIVKPKTEKVHSILIIKDPINSKQVHQFFGLVNFYRIFLYMCAETLGPINELTRKFKNFKWNEACNNDFIKIKNTMAKETLLVYPDFGKNYFIQK